MYILVLVSTLLTGRAWGMPANLKTCESYLTAPAELKEATLDLLKSKTSLKKRLERRAEMTAFMEAAPSGSRDLVDYLIKLEKNSPDGRASYMGDFAEHLLVNYLLRPENFDLAMENLDTLGNIFWLNFIYGVEEPQSRVDPKIRDRFLEGYAETENLIKFFSAAEGVQPEKVREAWLGAYNKNLDEVVRVQEFIRLMRRTVAALEAMSVDPTESAEELERRQYMTMLIQELEQPLKDFSADNLVQFHKWHGGLFRGKVYEEDMERCKGDGLEYMSPLRAFIFLFRLNQRLPPGLRFQNFAEVDHLIAKIKRLSSKHPAQSQT